MEKKYNRKNIFKPTFGLCSGECCIINIAVAIKAPCLTKSTLSLCNAASKANGSVGSTIPEHPMPLRKKKKKKQR